MQTDHLRINQLSADAYREYLTYLRAMDSRDVEAYTKLLGEKCVLHINNQQPVQGKAAIAGMLTPYWKSFSSIEHDLLNIYGTDDAFVLEALSHYVRLDGRQVTVPAVAFTDRNQEGLVTSVRLYMDVSPVFN